MKNKHYLVLYIILIGITTTNIIQTGWALSTGRFTELNPLGYNWFTIFMTFLAYIFWAILFFIKSKYYKKIFLIGIICSISISFGCFIHDYIVINVIFK